MCTIEMASTFFRCGTGKASKFHQPGSKAGQRDYEANDADDMQQIRMAGRTTVLFEHVAETELDSRQFKVVNSKTRRTMAAIANDARTNRPILTAVRLRSGARLFTIQAGMMLTRKTSAFVAP